MRTGFVVACADLLYIVGLWERTEGPRLWHHICLEETSPGLAS